jgi:hypothetical protein
MYVRKFTLKYLSRGIRGPLVCEVHADFAHLILERRVLD